MVRSNIIRTETDALQLQRVALTKRLCSSFEVVAVDSEAVVAVESEAVVVVETFDLNFGRQSLLRRFIFQLSN